MGMDLPQCQLRLADRCCPPWYQGPVALRHIFHTLKNSAHAETCSLAQSALWIANLVTESPLIFGVSMALGCHSMLSASHYHVYPQIYLPTAPSSPVDQNAMAFKVGPSAPFIARRATHAAALQARWLGLATCSICQPVHVLRVVCGVHGIRAGPFVLRGLATLSPVWPMGTLPHWSCVVAHQPASSANSRAAQDGTQKVLCYAHMATGRLLLAWLTRARVSRVTQVAARGQSSARCPCLQITHRTLVP